MLAWQSLNSSHHSAPNNNTTDISASVVAVLNNITAALWATVPPVLLVLGTFGNVMIVVVMRGMRGAQSTACLSVYFTALAVSDQCLLMTATLWFWIDEVFSWPPSFYVYDLLCVIPKCVWYTCSVTSAWFLVAMTYQRVVSVVTPHRVGVLCTVSRGKMVVVAIVAAACALNLHILVTFSYWHKGGQCSPLEEYTDFIYIFTWLDLFWASVIPFALLVVGNSVLVLQVIQSVSFVRKMTGKLTKDSISGNKVYPMTVTLILTSAAFLVLTLPICGFHAYRRTLSSDVNDDGFLAELNLARTVTLFLWSSASASNFYLYLLSGSKFRNETRRCLRLSV